MDRLLWKILRVWCEIVSDIFSHVDYQRDVPRYVRMVRSFLIKMPDFDFGLVKAESRSLSSFEQFKNVLLEFNRKTSSFHDHESSMHKITWIFVLQKATSASKLDLFWNFWHWKRSKILEKISKNATRVFKRLPLWLLCFDVLEHTS